jgi:hypothetical protein
MVEGSLKSEEEFLPAVASKTRCQLTNKRVVTVYHITPVVNLESIRRTGLIPKRGRLYIATSPNIAKEFAHQAYLGFGDHKLRPEEWALLEIKYRGEFPFEFYPDMEWGIPGVYFINEPIPPEHIELLEVFEATKSNEEFLPAIVPRIKLTIWDVVDRDKLRQYCEQVYGVPITTEASDYFARLMDRHIEGFKLYLPLHLIDHRALTAEDMYRAASIYFD